MDPATAFCPNLVCPARGHTGQGNICIHSCKDQRFMCTECHKTFSATTGTALYRLRTSAETVSLVVTLMAHGCPLPAIVVAFGYDERTVACWLARAGVQGQAVQEYLVEHPRDLGQVQADEIRVKKQGGMVWMALAMMVKHPLVAGGEVSAQPDMTLIRRLWHGCVAVRCLARSCSVPMACAPTSGRSVRPFAIRCIEERRGALGCVPGATSASPKLSSVMSSGEWSTSSGASLMGRPPRRDAPASLARGWGH